MYHVNPVRAHLIPPEAPLQTYPWSSYSLYLQEPCKRPSWLRVDRLLGEWGIPMDTAAGRAEFAGRMEARRRADGIGEYKPTGWCLGSEKFRQEWLAQISNLASPFHTGEDIHESAQAKAERIVQQELQALRWNEQVLVARRKGDPQKVRIAARLRRETTMTLLWIATRLSMGAPGHISCRLHRKEPNENQAAENKLF